MTQGPLRFLPDQQHCNSSAGSTVCRVSADSAGQQPEVVFFGGMKPSTVSCFVCFAFVEGFGRSQPVLYTCFSPDLFDRGVFHRAGAWAISPFADCFVTTCFILQLKTLHLGRCQVCHPETL